MIFRKTITSILILGFATETMAHVEIESEDYFFPLEPVINFKRMADKCLHDYIPICGQDSLGIARLFIDICDLYEYNSDQNKQFRHVKMSVCNYEIVPSPEATYNNKK